MRIIRNLLNGMSIGTLLLAVVVFAFDLGWLKPVYERVASHYLKQEVRLNGPVSVRVGQTIVASANDVLVMAEPSDDEPLARAGMITAHLDWIALWDGTIELSPVSLRDARLNLRVDETGRGNWPDFKPSEVETEEKPDAPPKFALRIGEAHLDRVEIRIRNPKLTRDFEADIHQLEGTSTSEISVIIRNAMECLSTSGNVCAARLRKANREMAAFEDTG